MSPMWAVPPTRSASAAQPEPPISAWSISSSTPAKLRPILSVESSPPPATLSTPVERHAQREGHGVAWRAPTSVRDCPARACRGPGSRWRRRSAFSTASTSSRVGAAGRRGRPRGRASGPPSGVPAGGTTRSMSTDRRVGGGVQLAVGVGPGVGGGGQTGIVSAGEGQRRVLHTQHRPRRSSRCSACRRRCPPAGLYVVLLLVIVPRSISGLLLGASPARTSLVLDFAGLTGTPDPAGRGTARAQLARGGLDLGPVGEGGERVVGGRPRRARPGAPLTATRAAVMATAVAAATRREVGQGPAVRTSGHSWGEALSRGVTTEQASTKRQQPC